MFLLNINCSFSNFSKKFSKTKKSKILTNKFADDFYMQKNYNIQAIMIKRLQLFYFQIGIRRTAKS